MSDPAPLKRSGNCKGLITLISKLEIKTVHHKTQDAHNLFGPRCEEIDKDGYQLHLSITPFYDSFLLYLYHLYQMPHCPTDLYQHDMTNDFRHHVISLFLLGSKRSE